LRSSLGEGSPGWHFFFSNSGKKSMNSETALTLYKHLIDAWNTRNADQFAELFSQDAICIGFDGSEMTGKSEIRSQLSGIFNDHPTASYITLIRETKELAGNVVMIRAHVGMIPPGKKKIDPKKNAVQVTTARISGRSGEIILFQNTPAQYHGRAEDQKILTRQLQNEFDKAMTESSY
jgi:uncharacterized protein (TIGR02246 family)